ncbi:MAG: hypothetical protein AAGA45_07450 [Verrucomicrobiota bacterium]
MKPPPVVLTLLLGWICLPLYALVNSGNPGGNTEAPTGKGYEPSDPGFAHAGRSGSASGVYLGNGWVLTAGHNPAGKFRSKPYIGEWDKVNDIKFKEADLRLYKLNKTFEELPPLSIADRPPEPDELLVMIGCGFAAEDHITFWKVDQSKKKWTWVELPSAEGANAAGILAINRYSKSWGTNRALELPPDVEGLIVTSFDSSPELITPYEAQAVTADSGGPVFVQTSEGWKLCGIMVTVSNTLPNQPRGEGIRFGIGSGVFGNQTVMVDLSTHREVIFEITGLPE